MISLVLLLCAVRAQAQVWPLYPLPYLRPLVTSQFHAQDELGQFNFGYAGNNQFRAESRLVDGSVRGSYSYVDPNNKVVRVVYIADSQGFRVLEGNNLPIAPQPAQQPSPVPVDYTPEVAAARAEFEKTYAELAAQAAAAGPETEATESETRRRRRSVLLPPFYTFTPSLKVKMTEREEVKDVVSPADTKPVEFTEVEKTVPLPPLLVAPAAFPYSPPYYTYYYHTV